MKNIADVLGEQRNRYDKGRTTLAKIQAIFDTAFGMEVCLVKLSQASLVVYVRSAGLASEVQMQKHHLVAQIQAIEPSVRMVRITIGLPRERAN